MEPLSVVLDPTLRCADAQDFEAQLDHRVVGQHEAVIKTTAVVQTFMAGFNPTDRPAGILLFLGPTGTGKTRLVEAVAEILFGTPKAVFKIACAEYQDSYQANRLLGAPPGYIGYSEGKGEGLLTQEKLDQYQKPDLKMNLVLFDEIEKAHERLYELMLNILDKGEITTSNGRKVDFTRSVIVMTSNLGAVDMGKSIGFSTGEAAVLDKNNVKVIEAAVKAKFKPEFLNRIDHQVVFKTLQTEHLRRILNLELDAVRRRLQTAPHHNKFVFAVARSAEDALLKEGFDAKYGARHLKRSIERRVVHPLASMSMSGQIALGDMVLIEFKRGQFQYRKYSGDDIAKLPDERWADFKSALINR